MAVGITVRILLVVRRLEAVSVMYYLHLKSRLGTIHRAVPKTRAFRPTALVRSITLQVISIHTSACHQASRPPPKSQNSVMLINLDLSSQPCLLPLLLDVPILIDKPLLPHSLERVMKRVELGLGGAVGAEVAVGPGEVLAVVDGEVHVVEGVVGGAVDVLLKPVARDHVAVVNEDGPDLHESEEGHVEVLLEGADEDEDAAVGVSGSDTPGSGDVDDRMNGTYWYGRDWT